MNAAALDGITVIDFSRVLAGPYATMLLGDFGADVIKIERPGVGDDTREWGPPYDDEGVATYFNSVNRNKRSVVLDLTDPDDAARARELVAGADIVVENFRPGTMEKLGLGYDTLREIQPDLIYCAITGFGRDGGASLPGYDLLVQAVGGLMSITGSEPGDPTKVGVAVVDAQGRAWVGNFGFDLFDHASTPAETTPSPASWWRWRTATAPARGSGWTPVCSQSCCPPW